MTQEEMVGGLAILVPLAEHLACCLHCEHDIFMVTVEKEKPTADQKKQLKKLGWFWSDEYDCYSHWCSA